MALIANRHEADALGMIQLVRVRNVLDTVNPRFGLEWSTRHCAFITHTHAMLTKFDSYAIEARALYDAVGGGAKALRTLATAQRWRNDKVLGMLGEHKIVLCEWFDLAAFGKRWESRGCI